MYFYILVFEFSQIFYSVFIPSDSVNEPFARKFTANTAKRNIISLAALENITGAFNTSEYTLTAGGNAAPAFTIFKVLTIAAAASARSNF